MGASSSGVNARTQKQELAPMGRSYNAFVRNGEWVVSVAA